MVKIKKSTWSHVLGKKLHFFQENGMFCDLYVTSCDDYKNCAVKLAHKLHKTKVPAISCDILSSDQNDIKNRDCLQAHSNVVAASSPLLQSLINGSSAMKASDQVNNLHIHNVSFPLLKQLLQFMYLGQVSANSLNLKNLKSVANDLMIVELKRCISSMKKPRTNAGNVQLIDCKLKNQEQQNSTSDEEEQLISFPKTKSLLQSICSSTYPLNEVSTCRATEPDKIDCRDADIEKIQKKFDYELARCETEMQLDVKMENNFDKGTTAFKNEVNLEIECLELLNHDNNPFQENEDEYLKQEKHVMVACILCQKKFATTKELKKHKKSSHFQQKIKPVKDNSKQIWKCHTCEKVFTRKHDFFIHQRVHSGEKPFSCNHCGKRFSQKPNMLVHEKIHKQEKMFKCNFCDKSFLRKWGLQEHEKLHTGEKPFLCQTCGKSFAKFCNLQVHERIHSGDKPFKCPMCPARFGDRSTLNQHQVIHKSDKAYQCSECGKQFSRSKSFKEHLHTHTGDKPHVCTVCNASFANTSNLSRHKKFHLKRKNRRVIKCEKPKTSLTDCQNVQQVQIGSVVNSNLNGTLCGTNYSEMQSDQSMSSAITNGNYLDISNQNQFDITNQQFRNTGVSFAVNNTNTLSNLNDIILDIDTGEMKPQMTFHNETVNNQTVILSSDNSIQAGIPEAEMTNTIVRTVVSFDNIVQMSPQY